MSINDDEEYREIRGSMRLAAALCLLVWVIIGLIIAWICTAQGQGDILAFLKAFVIYAGVTLVVMAAFRRITDGDEDGEGDDE